MAAAGMTREAIAGRQGMSERSVYGVLATRVSYPNPRPIRQQIVEIID